jgi:glutathione peroxidase-family protein
MPVCLAIATARRTWGTGGAGCLNCRKFLCDKSGVPVKHYGPQTAPSAIESDIAALL